MELSILRKKGYSLREIGEVLGVSASSVSRELKRNAIRTGKYVPDKANHKAWVRRKYSKYEGMKVREESWLEEYVKEKLEAGWTPEEISGRLQEKHGKCIVSHMAIYKWIYSVHGYHHAKYLPSKRHKKKKLKKKKTKRNLIPDRVWIDSRPSVINDRERVGDFEGDTLGRKRTASSQTLVGAVCRLSRFFKARKVKSLKYSMEDGFQRMFEDESALSLTLDNGPENVRHKSLGIPTYFCHPYSSWEKGSIENVFQRLRRYIPKGSDIADFSDEEIASIVERMNNTPRKCLGFKTPAEVFKEHFT